MAVVTGAAVLGAGATIAAAASDRRSAKEGLKLQKDQNRDNAAFIEEKTSQAREEAIPLFRQAQENRLLGGQGALDIFGQSIPQQQEQFQEGNVLAQAVQLGGLEQVRNAILGQPVDLSGARPLRIPTDTSFIPQQLPEFNLGTPQTPSQQTAQTLGGAITNEDLFRLASMGDIPGLSPEDQAFFGQHLQNILGVDPADTSFVSDPTGSVENILSQPQGTGFNQENRNRIADLVRNFQGGL